MSDSKNVPSKQFGIGGGELQPEFAASCLIPFSASDARVEADDTLTTIALRIFSSFPVNEQQRSNWLSPQDWLSLATSNVELFTSISQLEFWLVFIGYKLDGDICGEDTDVTKFSMLRLALNILECSKPSGRAFHSLLCDYTVAYESLDNDEQQNTKNQKIEQNEETTLNPKFYTNPWSLSKVDEQRTITSSLVPLIICLNHESSHQYWLNKIKMRFKSTTFPTAAQAIEVTSILQILLLSKSMSLISIKTELLKDVASLNNKPLISCFVAFIVKNKINKIKSNQSCQEEKVNEILHLDKVLTTLDMILYFIAMFFNVQVDELKAEKWNQIKKWQSPPQYIRRIVVLSLARLSPLALFGIFKKKGLWKHIFRTMHLEHIASKMCHHHQTDKVDIEKVEWYQEKELLFEGFENVVLISALLHGVKYPATPEAYVKERYDDRVHEPLLRLLNDPLFTLSPESSANQSSFSAEGTDNHLNSFWLDPNHQFHPFLALKKVPSPICQLPATMLSIGGNTRAQWMQLLECGQLTPLQVLANIRSLILLNIDPALGFGDLLFRKQKAVYDDHRTPPPVIDPLKALKLKLFLKNEFCDKEIQFLMQSISDNSNPTLVYPTLGEVKVIIPLRTFRDKDSKVTEVKNGKKNISISFSKTSLTQYLDILDMVYIDGINSTISPSSMMIDADAAVDKSTSLRAMVVLTSELMNPPRSGLPPKIPDYSMTSLWRNESICLQELHSLLPQAHHMTDSLNGLERLLFGINWCEAPGSHGGGVDLDIAVMAYDKDWKFLYDCSYTHLKAKGLTHSGDFTSAPYPNGARETIDVNLKEIQEQAPDVKYLACICFSYSGQSMDSLFDASVFVADPLRAGSGPGQTCVLTAARLTGKGKSNLAAFVTLDQGARQTLTCVDTTLNISATTSTAATGLVASCLKRLTSAAAEQEQRLTIGQIAAMQAIAAGADEVMIMHGGIRQEQAVDENGDDDATKSGCEVLVMRKDRSNGIPIGSYDHLFFEKLRVLMLSMKPCTCVNWEKFSSLRNPSEKINKKTLIFTGELITYREAARSTPSLWFPLAQVYLNEKGSSVDAHQSETQISSSSALAVVNMRSDDNCIKQRSIKHIGVHVPVTCISGVNMLKEINQWASM